MLNYINVESFLNFAQFKIYPAKGYNFTDEILRNNAIVFCKTDYLGMLFDKLRFTNRKYVLISHASDYGVDERIFKMKPSCIIKWFAQNVIYNHPDLIPIPIGLFPEISKQVVDDLQWFSNNVEILKSNAKDLEILYCNWNPQNHPTRQQILDKFDKNKIKYIWDRKKMIEVVAVYDKNLSFEEYCKNMSKYKFVVSPRGNGIDGSRTWEALHMGCFPIVIKSITYKEYDDMPLIQVNDYSEITYDLLNFYLNREYNYSKLYMSYWKERILNEFNKL